MTWLLLLLEPPERYYLGQVRRRYGQVWETVTCKCRSPGTAFTRALMSMTDDDYRARAILVDESNPHGPVPVLEQTR